MSKKPSFALILVGYSAINIFKIFSKISKQENQKHDETVHNNEAQISSHCYESHIEECPIEIGYSGEQALECYD